MSFAYVCRACGRVFRADDYAKSGVLNKMCKTVDLVGGATANAGLYSAHPTIRCPYCYAKDTSIATEGQRLKGLLRQRTYPPIDAFRYVWLMTAQRYEDCFVNVHAVEHRIEGLSDDAQLRLLPELERCNWQIDRVFLKGLTTLFTKPILCYDTSRNTFSAYERENVVFALRQGGEMDEYEISEDGAQWLSYNEAKTEFGAALLNRANRIICGYSMMILV